MNEFDAIERYFAPLAANAPGALDLKDDAALLDDDWVVTADTVVEGVHFLSDDPLDLVARKALRVTLSDLAAKAAQPRFYVLCLAWPRGRDIAEMARFAQGLAEDQAEFGVALIGGDTTTTPGPLTASITAFGQPGGAMLRRGGARAGDRVFVTGAIGDAALGLKSLRGELGEGRLTAGQREWLERRYRLPTPRLSAIEALSGRASAAIDISDGLMADLGHVAAASGVGMEIDLAAAPLSSAASAWLADQPDEVSARAALATAGDDYEIAFTAGSEKVSAIIDCAGRAGLEIAEIGRVTSGAGVVLRSADGEIVRIERSGFTHF